MSVIIRLVIKSFVRNKQRIHSVISKYYFRPGFLVLLLLFSRTCNCVQLCNPEIHGRVDRDFPSDLTVTHIMDGKHLIIFLSLRRNHRGKMKLFGKYRKSGRTVSCSCRTILVFYFHESNAIDSRPEHVRGYRH